VNDSFDQLQTLVTELGLGAACQPQLKTNPSGLPSAWMALASPEDLPRFALALSKIGGRLATTTVYRPNPADAPGTHELAYHMLLDGLPITAKVTLQQGQGSASIARLFPNADWEEREMMELGGVKITDHPNPRRMFLDETIEVGVFDRYVPYSEFTNAADHNAVWARIKEESCQARKRKQEAAELAQAQVQHQEATK
jgi:NADH:ubiquinone oxidoreductase subunit C